MINTSYSFVAFFFKKKKEMMLFKKKMYLHDYACFCVWVCAHEHNVHRVQKRAPDSPRTGVKGGYKLLRISRDLRKAEWTYQSLQLI